MTEGEWKIGTLAERTGVSVRTLHHYDQIGLLSPSARTRSSHRIYTDDDVKRLQQIVSLKQMGLSLEQIAGFLSGSSGSLRRVIGLQLAKLREQIDRQQRLCARLEAIADRLGTQDAVPIDEFMVVIRETEMIERFEKHYTPEQLKQLEERRAVVGAERIRQAEGEWQSLIAAVRSRMEADADPSSEPVMALARQWMGLIDEFTGADPGIAASLREMYKEDPNIVADKGYTPDARMMEYIGKAIAAVRNDG